MKIRTPIMIRGHQNLAFALLLFVLVVIFGTIGYQVIEGWRFLDALYMTIITLATIGFREVHTLSDGGMVFTLVLIIFGVVTVAFAAKVATQVMLEGQVRNILGRRKVKKTIRGLKKHYIVCGYGRMGKIIMKEFVASGVPFVIIERDPDVVAEVSDPKVLIFQGDARQDEVLEEASIQTAAGLISVLQSDADNLLVVLSARGLNPDLRIVARASDDGVAPKLVRAGANKVVSPYHMGGIRMAQAMLKPAVTDFLEITVQDKTVDLDLEQLQLSETSPLVGKTLTESNIRRDFDVILVAIKRADGSMLYNPTKDTRLSSGDTLIVLGEQSKLDQLEAVTGRSD